MAWTHRLTAIYPGRIQPGIDCDNAQNEVYATALPLELEGTQSVSEISRISYNGQDSFQSVRLFANLQAAENFKQFLETRFASIPTVMTIDQL